MVKVATAAVIEKNNKVLIGKRKKDQLWEFPGGKIDPGETPEQCIIREIKEELNLEIVITRSFDVIRGFYRQNEMELYAYCASWVGGQLSMNVHQAIEWIAFEDIDRFPFVEEDQEVIRILRGEMNYERK